MFCALMLWLALGFLPQDAAALWTAGRRAEAVEVRATEVAARSADLALRRELAGWQMVLHRYSAALATLDAMPSATRAETDAMRGRALAALGRYEQALEHLPRTDFAGVCQRIDALEALGRIDEADAEIDLALKLAAPNDARADELAGRRAARRGRFDEAVAAFRSALAKEPLDRAALFGLGQALVKSGKRDDGARVLAEHRRLLPLLDQLDFAEQSLDLDPRNGPNYASLGDAERALGRIERAEAAYVRAEELAEPDQLVPIVLRHARLLAEDRRDIDGAVRLLEAAAQRTPDPRLLVRAGDLLAEAGRAREAVERLERALALRPQDAQIQRRLEAARAALSK